MCLAKVNPAPRAYARGIRGSLRGNNPFIPDLTVRAFWVRGKPENAVLPSEFPFGITDMLITGMPNSIAVIA